MEMTTQTCLDYDDDKPYDFMVELSKFEESKRCKHFPLNL